MDPLRLPDDFNQTINNQFCFILQNNDGNYSLNVNALNDYAMSNIIQANGTNTSFMNASETVQENMWYNVRESISDYRITTNLYNVNGTLLESTVTPYNAVGSSEAITLIANNIDSAVILKNLAFQTLNDTTQQPPNIEKTTNGNGSLFPYVILSILLVTAFSVALVYGKKKIRMRQKTKNPVQDASDLNTTVNQVNP